MNPKVSVVVLNYNGQKYLDPCLKALGRQTFRDFEIILVDNNSSDDSTAYVRTHFPEITIIETKENLGFAGGTNVGIRAATGEYILTINNDTIADHRLIENLVAPMMMDSRLGMCAPKMVLPDGRINSTGICISRSGAAWDRGIFEKDTGCYEREEEVFGPCAGAALYRRIMLDEIGLFDEDFFIYMEDVDLAFRARMAGWACRYIPSARIVHHLGGTSGVHSDFSVFYGNRNQIWNAIKNFPTMTLLISLPWIIGKNCADIPFYILHGKGVTIFRSKASALRGITRMLRKRRASVRKVPEMEIRKWICVWMEHKPE
jgi:GT2 family glycosyltransferase